MIQREKRQKKGGQGDETIQDRDKKSRAEPSRRRLSKTKRHREGRSREQNHRRRESEEPGEV